MANEAGDSFVSKALLKKAPTVTVAGTATAVTTAAAVTAAATVTVAGTATAVTMAAADTAAATVTVAGTATEARNSHHSGRGCSPDGDSNSGRHSHGGDDGSPGSVC